MLLSGFARDVSADLFRVIGVIATEAPFRHLITPGGFRMSVAMTNCGDVGWTPDRRGYRYDRSDPESGRPWPLIPALFRDLAVRAASAAGFEGFDPDGCLINRYEPGSRLTQHQDRDEYDLGAPIVSVSLGLPGHVPLGRRSALGPAAAVAPRTRRRRGPGRTARLVFHGIDALKPGDHPATGAFRYNLTLRRARYLERFYTFRDDLPSIGLKVQLLATYRGSILEDRAGWLDELDAFSPSPSPLSHQRCQVPSLRHKPPYHRLPSPSSDRHHCASA